jgi:prepilin signal peptidase PulO-like enzyme (type II secretory pathway)
VTDILQERNHFEPQACTVRVDVHCPKCNATLVQILGYTSLSFSCKCRCCNHAWDTPVGSIF